MLDVFVVVHLSECNKKPHSDFSSPVFCLSKAKSKKTGSVVWKVGTQARFPDLRKFLTSWFGISCTRKLKLNPDKIIKKLRFACPSQKHTAV